jgi:hypothetical protein
VVSFAASPASTLLAAAGLHVVALGLSTRLPHALGRQEAAQALPTRLARGFFLATGAGGFAWFVMSAGMLHGPLTLAACSATPAFIGGAMGWHLFSMYGPAAFAGRWRWAFPPLPATVVGLALLCVGAAAVQTGASVASVTAGLVGIGVGWGLVNIAALRLLHEGSRPPRWALALHDVCLLAAAAAGALAF